MTRRLGAALVAASLALPAPALSQQCLTRNEAGSLARAALPETVAALTARCRPSLGAGAYLTRSSAALSDRMRPAADAAFPVAKAAFARAINQPALARLKDATVRDLMAGGIGDALGKLKPGDCMIVDGILEALDPLPPQNVAALIVVMLDLGGKTKVNAGPLSICKSS